MEKQIWLWYRHDQDLLYTCDQMSEEQFTLPTFLPRTAIVGIKNIYDFPNALLELNDTLKRSLLGIKAAVICNIVLRFNFDFASSFLKYLY